MDVAVWGPKYTELELSGDENINYHGATSIFCAVIATFTLDWLQFFQRRCFV